MKTLIITLLVLGLAAIAIVAFLKARRSDIPKIKVGSKVPMFSLKDQNGVVFDMVDHVGKRSMVIYFYPQDDTPGCTKEACAFRDAYKVFTDAGFELIGISSDDQASHKKFETKYNLPFTLLSDTENKVRRLFGAGEGMFPGRVTYIIDKSGTVVHVYDSMAHAEEHVTEALKYVK
jgi:thioredoxin-dependent peroxiredoxin